MTVKLALLFIVCLQAMLASGQLRQQGQIELPQAPLDVHHLELALTWAPTAIKVEEVDQIQEQPLARLNFENYLRHHDHAFLVLGLRAYHFEEELGFEVSSRTSNCDYNPYWDVFQDWGTDQGEDPDRVRNLVGIDGDQRYWPNIFEDNPTDLFQWEWVRTVFRLLTKQFLASLLSS